jgi:hypothetical protein
MRRLALLALCLAACGTPTSADPDAGAPDAGPPPLTADEACAARAAASCERLSACSIFALQTRFGDLATCEARQKLACTLSLAAPDTGATPATDEACAAALKTVACDAYLDGDLPEPCLPRVGTRVAGAACLFAAQCQSAFCGIAKGSTCGTCTTAPGIGSSCATFACKSGLICVKETSLCESPEVLNASCDRGHPCGPGLSCVGQAAGTPGRCGNFAAAENVTCDPKEKVAPDCDHRLGLFCVANQCARATYATAGQACGAVNGSAVACLADANCEKPAGSNQGTCVAPAADGAACDADVGPHCTTPARCVPTVAGQPAGLCLVPDTSKCP